MADHFTCPHGDVPPPGATAPLPPAAVHALHRLELALANRTVANFDNHGSFWGFDTVEKTEADIAEARTAGTDIDEWETVDRDGQPLRVVRLADPTFLDTICVIPTDPDPDMDEALRRVRAGGGK